MSTYKQLITPNLDPYVYEGGKLLTDWWAMCLATVETAFGTARLYAYAWLGWLAAVNKHEDRDWPRNVYFIIWFSGYGGEGHVAFARVDDAGNITIWTSPKEHKPYFDNYTDVDQLARDYGVTYVGWSEDLAGSQIIELVPDPTPPPAPAPTPAAPAVPANIVFTKLDSPLNLVTNRDAQKWSLDFDVDANAVSVQSLPNGTPFVAYGKGQRTDHDKPCYYMTAEDFGNADTTGIPTNNYGVNTVDLSPAPAVIEPVETVPVTVVPSKPLASASAPMTDVVPVAPVDPNAWKKVFVNKGRYISKVTQEIHDIVTGITIGKELAEGQMIVLAGRYIKDGVAYGLTQTAVDSKLYYDIKMSDLTLVEAVDIEDDDDSIFSELLDKNFIADVEAVSKNIINKVKSSASLREKIVNLVARFVFRAKKTKIGA